MTKEYYECHVTMKVEERHLLDVKYVVNIEGWTFSKIDGDIDLGVGVKCYATHQYSKRVELSDVKERMEEMAVLCAGQTAKILRKKIEVIIYDVRL